LRAASFLAHLCSLILEQGGYMESY